MAGVSKLTYYRADQHGAHLFRVRSIKRHRSVEFFVQVSTGVEKLRSFHILACRAPQMLPNETPAAFARTPLFLYYFLSPTAFPQKPLFKRVEQPARIPVCVEGRDRRGFSASQILFLLKDFQAAIAQSAISRRRASHPARKGLVCCCPIALVVLLHQPVLVTSFFLVDLVTPNSVFKTRNLKTSAIAT